MGGHINGFFDGLFYYNDSSLISSYIIAYYRKSLNESIYNTCNNFYSVA